jgi:hypothetical protein
MINFPEYGLSHEEASRRDTMQIYHPHATPLDFSASREAMGNVYLE